jgi:FkbM family methyltransferase
MYSQNNEEQFILAHFKGKIGRFLDIGAYDGRTFSNTLALVEQGWTGVCVEPSPSVFVSLLKLHGKNPRVKLVNATVGFKTEFVNFYDSDGDAISSLSLAHVAKWTANSPVVFTPYYVYTITLPMLFDQFGCDYDFINIDVEGSSYQLFTTLPMHRLDKTTLLCVEHDGNLTQAIQVGNNFNFHALTSNGENVILAR